MPYPFSTNASTEGQIEEDPRVEAVRSCLGLLARAVKGRRLYPPGNPVLQGYVQRAFAAFQPQLAPSLDLAVRDDRFYFGRSSVYVDPDRLEGLPFLMFQNTIQRFALDEGLDPEELSIVVDCLAFDYRREGSGGEDLVTALWRAHLPHFRYTVIDLFNMKLEDVSEDDPLELFMDEELRRLREEVGLIGTALGVDRKTGKVGLPDARDGGTLPRVAPHPLTKPLSRGELAAFSEAERTAHRKEEQSEALLLRLTGLVFRNLFEDDAAHVEATPSWRLLHALLRSLLESQAFEATVSMTEALDSLLGADPRPGAPVLAERVRTLLGNGEEVGLMLDALDQTTSPAQTRAVLALLDYAGDHAYEAVLERVDGLEKPISRRRVVDLLVRHTLDGDDRIIAVARRSAPVLRDLLASPSLPSGPLRALVKLGVVHGEAAVRAQATAILRTFSGPEADKLIVRAFDDQDDEVRRMAYRVGGHRESQVVLDAFLARMKDPSLDGRSPKELRALLGGAVALAGPRLVPILAHLLNDAGSRRLFHRKAELRVAAAHALAPFDTPAAKAALEKGTKTMNRAVKAACQSALTQPSSPPPPIDRSTPRGPLVGPAPVTQPTSVTLAASRPLTGVHGDASQSPRSRAHVPENSPNVGRAPRNPVAPATRSAPPRPPSRPSPTSGRRTRSAAPPPPNAARPSTPQEPSPPPRYAPSELLSDAFLTPNPEPGALDILFESPVELSKEEPAEAVIELPAWALAPVLPEEKE